MPIFDLIDNFNLHGLINSIYSAHIVCNWINNLPKKLKSTPQLVRKNSVDNVIDIGVNTTRMNRGIFGVALLVE